MPEMNLRTLIAEHGASEDGEQAARDVIRALLRDHADLAAVLLYPIVHDEIRRIRRQQSRRAEDKAFGGPADSGDPLAPLRQLRNRSFLDPATRMLVTWGSASPQQHEGRAEWLRITKLVPVQQTIDRHRYAARVLREAAASCLNEVSGYEPVPV